MLTVQTEQPDPGDGGGDFPFAESDAAAITNKDK